MFCCFSGKKSQTKAIESNTTKLQKKVNYRKSPNPILEPISERSPEESIFSRNNSKPILGFDGSNTTTKKFENIGITPQLSIKEEEEEENNLPQKEAGSQQNSENRCKVTRYEAEGNTVQTIFDYTEYYNNCDIDTEAFDILNTKMFKETISFEDVNLEEILHSDVFSSVELAVLEAELSQDRVNEGDEMGTLKIDKESDITLDNFHFQLQKVQVRMDDESDQCDQSLNRSSLEAENDFYCKESKLNEQFSRAVVAYGDSTLAKTLFEKMSQEEKNAVDDKDYTPIQIVVLKALCQEQFIGFAKSMIYHQHVNLECRSPGGWTPLQQALIYRNIPLSTHLFKAGYIKRQLKFQAGLLLFQQMLKSLPDFSIEVNVKVDSFLPFVGALTPDDTLKIVKIGGRIRLDYTLVGYQFPFCKRREMSIFFDGKSMLGLNASKGTYCDLFEALDQEEMILLVEDMLVSQIKKGEPIIHDVKLNKCLTLFDNQIIEEIGGLSAIKYQLDLKYTSTAEKRRSNANGMDVLSFVSDYNSYTKRQEEIVIQEKNKNKKVGLEVFLVPEFGLKLDKFVDILGILGTGNSLLSKWSGFLKEKVGPKVTEGGLFPIKIDVPLNYSLFFKIEFRNFTLLESASAPLVLNESLKKVERKAFQGIMQSKEKRKLFLQAYT